MPPTVLSVNIAIPQPNPFKPAKSTGISKRPHPHPVEVRDPGAKTTGLGSGLVGDFVGDGKHHGGSEQAVYAFAREDLDHWQCELGRVLPDGYFGENLTTAGLEVSDALIGERWRIGDTVELAVTSPRLPCSTFRGWVGERGWLRRFTALGRSGAYLRVVVPGFILRGDGIVVVHRPDHAITASLMFRALTLERQLLPTLLAAGDYLPEETRLRAAAAAG